MSTDESVNRKDCCCSFVVNRKKCNKDKDSIKDTQLWLAECNQKV